jgi:hypothetical protein
MGGQRHASAALLPGKTRYPLYSRKGGLQGRSRGVWKTTSPPGSDPRTVQPVASRCTDWAIPAPESFAVFLFLKICMPLRFCPYIVRGSCTNMWNTYGLLWNVRDGAERNAQRRPVYHTSYMPCPGIESDSLCWEVSKSPPDKMTVALYMEPQ